MISFKKEVLLIWLIGMGLIYLFSKSQLIPINPVLGLIAASLITGVFGGYVIFNKTKKTILALFFTSALVALAGLSLSVPHIHVMAIAPTDAAILQMIKTDPELSSRGISVASSRGLAISGFIMSLLVFSVPFAFLGAWIGKKISK